MQFYYHLLRILLIPFDFLSKLRKRRKPEKIYFEKVNKLFKEIKNLKVKVFKGVNEFIKYDREAYIYRNSNEKLTEYLLDEISQSFALVLGKSMIGKTSLVYNEIIRNRKKLKNWLVLIPEDFKPLEKWNRKLPLWVKPQNKILFIDDINRFAPLSKQGLSEIVNVLSKRGKLKFIATCRSGNEWNSVKSEFGDFFKIKIEPEKISDDDAEKLARIENKEISNFDGSPGSIILGIKRQREKITNLKEYNPNCYNILKSAAVIYYFLWYRKYEKKLVKEISKYILDIPDFERNFGENITFLKDNEIVSYKDGKEIIIPDPYLDEIINTFIIEKEIILYNFDKYLKRMNANEEIISRLADFYTFKLGISYSYKGEYNKAIECYKKALEINPDNYEAWVNMGTAYGKKGDYAKAIECFQKALEINPADYKAWNNMGLSYSKKGDNERSIEYYKKALEIKTDYHEAWSNLGVTYDQKGDHDKAIKCYKMAIETKPDFYEAWSNLGNVYEKKGEYNRAIECFKKVIEINPKFNKSWNNMGNNYYKKGDHEKSIKCYQKAVEIKPDSHEAWNNMGVTYDHKGDHAKAIDCFQKAVDIKPDSNEIWYNIGIAYGKKSDQNEAIKCFQKVVEINPDDYKAWDNMGNNYYKKGDHDKSIECYQKAVDIKLDYHEAWSNLGSVYHFKGEYDKAINCFQKVVEIKPDYHEAWYDMGVAYSYKGEHDKAINCYKKTLELKPDFNEAWNNLGSAYYFKDEYDQAIDCYDNLIKTVPEFILAYENLIEIYIKTNDFHKALNICNKSHDIAKDSRDRAIIYYLECIIRKMLDMDLKDTENKLKNLLKLDFKLTWSFDEIEEWLKKSDFEQDKRNYIIKLTNLLRTKKK